MDLLKWPIVRSQVRHPSSLLANGNPLHLDRLQPSDRAVLFVCSRSLLQLCSLFLRQLKAASRGKLQWTKYLHTNKQLRYVGNKSKLKHLPIVSKISPPQSTMDLMFNVQYLFFSNGLPGLLLRCQSLLLLLPSASRKTRGSAPRFNEVPSQRCRSNNLGQLHISLVLQLHKLWHSSSLDCQLLG